MKKIYIFIGTNSLEGLITGVVANTKDEAIQIIANEFEIFEELVVVSECVYKKGLLFYIHDRRMISTNTIE